MAPINIVVILVILGVGLVAAAPCGTPCLYTDKLWGDVDPNVFNFCDPSTNTTVQQACGSGRGFISNGTDSGCVPFSEWPSQCVTQVSQAPSCQGDNLNQPSVASNPNEFYLCTAECATPVLVSCESGKGFISNSKFLGCMDWADWRAAKCCYTY